MKTKAQNVADTRWKSMFKVNDWFRKHRVAALAYLSEKNPPCTPPLTCYSKIVGQADVDYVDLEFSVLSQNEKYPIELKKVEDKLIDLGDFFQATRKEIGVEEVASNVKNIVISCVIMIAGLANIEAERDSRNDAADSIPPVLPHQLVRLRGREFTDIIRKQKDRLSYR
ncbi:unnamed protein product [Peronospora farinosa]|uniref:Uncharacterized protein n=1 Tax=Peronospora farinosa TaxID=134698 RepID=A0AAV0SSU7_9STRA|nr:unnamed protein product [Peronospora farinosa]